MKYQEKKYEVKSFDEIIEILDKLGAKKVGGKTTEHFYGQHKGNNVVKLVKYADRDEIHVLKEVGGKFSLVESNSMKDTKEGLQDLKNRGYEAVDVIKMENTDYEHKGGLVRLYLIDDFLPSVILDYPEGKHEDVEKELSLEDANRISIPYNKQLKKLGKLRTRKL